MFGLGQAVYIVKTSPFGSETCSNSSAEKAYTSISRSHCSQTSVSVVQADLRSSLLAGNLEVPILEVDGQDVKSRKTQRVCS